MAKVGSAAPTVFHYCILLSFCSSPKLFPALKKTSFFQAPFTGDEKLGRLQSTGEITMEVVAEVEGIPKTRALPPLPLPPNHFVFASKAGEKKKT